MNIDTTVRTAPALDRVDECQRQRAAIRDHEIAALEEVTAHAEERVERLLRFLVEARSDLTTSNARLSVLREEKSREVQP